MYAKHSNLVDADAPGAKASTKHLESRVFKVTHFAITDSRPENLGGTAPWRANVPRGVRPEELGEKARRGKFLGRGQLTRPSPPAKESGGAV